MHSIMVFILRTHGSQRSYLTALLPGKNFSHRYSGVLHQNIYKLNHAFIAVLFVNEAVRRVREERVSGGCR